MFVAWFSWLDYGIKGQWKAKEGDVFHMKIFRGY
jgi:hypothetical protein